MAELTIANLTGFFKKVYSDKLIQLVPESNKIIKGTRFDQKDRIGDSYEQPVITSQEQGVTYAGPTAGAFALEAAEAMATKNVSVQSYQMMIRGQMGYDVAMRASTDENSFARSTALQVKNMLASISKRLEIQFLHGQSTTGIGTVTTGGISGTSTSRVVIIQEKDFAPGIWAGLTNAYLVFRDSALALVSTGVDSKFKVVSVDYGTRAVTLSCTATGGTALDSAVGAGTCAIYFSTAYQSGTTFNECMGITKILSTSSGSLFGCDSDLFKGNQYSAGNAALNFTKINESLEIAVSVGGLNEKVKVWISPKTWNGLLGDLAANRIYDSTYKNTELENGSQAICFYSMAGKIEIEAHPMIKRGEAIIIPDGALKRIGSTDITFNNPKTGKEIFRELNDNAGFEMRAYCDQAIFIEEPRKCVYITGIVN
jgi:hypothetical protein